MASTRRSRSSTATFEQVTWNKTTFQFPPKPPTKIPDEEKFEFFQRTVHAIDVTNCDYQTRISALSSRFDHEHLLTRVQGLTSHLIRVGEDDAPVRLHNANPGVFTYSDVRLKNSILGQLALQDPLLPPTRLAARVLLMSVIVNPRNHFPGEQEILQAADLPSKTFNVGMFLPVETNAAGVTSLHAGIAGNHLLHLQQGLELIRFIQIPEFGFVHRPGGNNTDIQLDTERFKQDFLTFVNQCRYRLLKVLVRKEYVGDVAAADATVLSSLNDVRQMSWDRRSMRPLTKSVEEYYIEFMKVLSLIPAETAFPTDPSVLFFSNVSREIRNQAKSDQYAPPPAPPNETKQAALARLQGVKTQLIAYEKQVQNIRDLSGSARATSRSGQGATAFATIPQLEPSQPARRHNAFLSGRCRGFSPHPEEDSAYLADVAEAQEAAYFQAAATGQDFGPTFVPASNVSALPCAYCMLCQADSSAPPVLADTMVPQVESQVACLMSVCENSMRQATGQARPIPECWGCTGHPRYHEQRFHLYSQCPNKHDPQVQANGNQGMREYVIARQRGGSSKPAPAATRDFHNWEQEGHPSPKAAQLISQIADPNTLPTVRKACYKALKTLPLEDPSPVTSQQLASVNNANASVNNANPAQEEETQSKRKRNNGNGGIRSFVLIPYLKQAATVVLQAVRKTFNADLNITQAMPHIKIAIGLDGKAVLEVMTDTCAGLNLGSLAYHLSLYESNPHLVYQFAYIKDVDNLDAFSIGGISREAGGIEVTAVIAYKTPYRVDGQPVVLTIALSEHAAANTIFGLPFLRATQSSLLLDPNGNDVIAIQKLGHTFRVEYHPPFRADKVPQQDRLTQATYHSVPVAQSAFDSVAQVREKFHSALLKAPSQPSPENAPDFVTGIADMALDDPVHPAAQE